MEAHTKWITRCGHWTVVTAAVTTRDVHKDAFCMQNCAVQDTLTPPHHEQQQTAENIKDFVAETILKQDEVFFWLVQEHVNNIELHCRLHSK